MRVVKRRDAALSLLALTLTVAPALYGQQAAPGKAVYDKWCAGCHGVDGKGDGPAAGYMLPRPRDFTQGIYQIRVTPSGALPRDEDLLRVIDEGMPGTAMPGWRTVLSKSDRQALVDYLKGFSHFFAQGPAPDAIRIGKAPGLSEEGLAEGKEFYDKIECWKCHGRAGRGDGPSAPTQDDELGFPIRPADLSENWTFNGGGTVEDVYRRLRTGMDGTPMPSFSDLVEAGFLTDEQLWRVAQYAHSLSPEKPPRVREVIRASRIEGELPSSPDDSAWAAAERFYVPLVGQVVVKPRWFAPTVDGVWVEALHNERDLALRLVWHDPSQSPDSAWLEWQARVLATVEPREGAPAEARLLPDVFAVQFPRRIPSGMERPYFLMGNAREPVHVWRWQSQPAAAVEATARGLNRIEPEAGRQALAGQAVFDQGEWRLVLRRPLATADPTDQLQFATGVAIPIAFFAWDGSNAEEGTRGAISTWYFLYLERETPARVYTAPVATMLLTAGLGLLVVVRAQRRQQHEAAA
ncbi:MAG: c-type cytochrome [Gemmatimonadetes bacterium]|nr:c-type cytochrome [Gemmatimonadota bacterium]